MMAFEMKNQVCCCVIGYFYARLAYLTLSVFFFIVKPNPNRTFRGIALFVLSDFGRKIHGGSGRIVVRGLN